MGDGSVSYRLSVHDAEVTQVSLESDSVSQATFMVKRSTTPPAQ